VAIRHRAGGLTYKAAPTCSRIKRLSFVVPALLAELVRMPSPVVRMSSAFLHEQYHTERM
jgi:hypothetical protein